MEESQQRNNRVTIVIRSRSSAVNQETGPLARRYRVPFPVVPRDFFFKTSIPALGPRPGLIVNWYRVPFLGLKRPEREVGHSAPPSGKIKNDRTYRSAPCTCLHDMHQEHVTCINYNCVHYF